jgi:hypothetical protein
MISLDRCGLRWRVNHGGRALLWHRFGTCIAHLRLLLRVRVPTGVETALPAPMMAKPQRAAQHTPMTSRNAATPLLRPAGHPRMCAVHVPAIPGMLDCVTWCNCRKGGVARTGALWQQRPPARCDLTAEAISSSRTALRHGTRALVPCEHGGESRSRVPPPVARVGRARPRRAAIGTTPETRPTRVTYTQLVTATPSHPRSGFSLGLRYCFGIVLAGS